MDQPISYTISEAEFDCALLPKAGRKVGTEAFRKHVTKYFRKQYEGQDGEVTVDFADGAIHVRWMPAAADREPMEAIIALLQAGDYAKAAPMLETLLQANPNDVDALYNLGMVYSDQGRLDEAQTLLKRATGVQPSHANAWTALGVAATRARNVETARQALEQAIALDPENPYALRTLGTLHAINGEHTPAITRLRAALALAPNDPMILLSLGQTLLEQDPAGNAPEADGLLQRVLKLAPHGELAAKAKDLRRGVASQHFREASKGTLRPDAVSYCLGALEQLEGMSKTELAPLLAEMSTLGQSGLAVNNPQKRYRLQCLPGEFTGLQIVCLLHVGVKKIDPAMSSGMDLEAEYEEALRLYRPRH